MLGQKFYTSFLGSDLFLDNILVKWGYFELLSVTDDDTLLDSFLSWTAEVITAL